MIKQMLSEAGLTPFAVFGLVAFVTIFVGVTLWTLTRRSSQIATWSSMPLNDGMAPLEPRKVQADTSLPITGSCGKCDDCDCTP